MNRSLPSDTPAGEGAVAPELAGLHERLAALKALRALPPAEMLVALGLDENGDNLPSEQDHAS